MHQARENLAGASSGQVLPSAYSEHAATQPRQAPGLEHSHLGGPAQAGPQGASGIDGTKPKTVGANNMAASVANDDRVAPGTWQDVAERMVLVTLPARGRPYKRPDLEDAVIRTKFPPNMIETFGEFERNFKYQMTFKTRQQAEAFCNRNDKITVCNDKGQIECTGADPGHGLGGAQPARPHPSHTPAALPATNVQDMNPLLNSGWANVANRMATISLGPAGRPYQRADIENALLRFEIDCSTIVTLGEYDNFKYQITFSQHAVADYFVCNNPVLPVTSAKDTFDCPVNSFLRHEFRVKVAWFPDAGTVAEMATNMSQWGQVLSISRERVRGAFCTYFSGVRIVTIIPRDVDVIPDFADMRVHGKLYTVRMTVMGLPARCHNCQIQEHLARDCTACGRCGSAAHSTSDHPAHIPFFNFC